MTSDDRLSLILRRLNEIERKLDLRDELRMMETSTAIGCSARRGSPSKRIEGLKEQISGLSKQVFGPDSID
jgi:hypothetical protein